MVSRNYWLHRISHEAECSYPLLEKGYLTIGWLCYSDSTLLNDYNNYGDEAFRKFMSNNNQNSRSRYNLKLFMDIKIGDKIVVPLYNKKFAIYEAVEIIKPISALPIPPFNNWSNEEVSLTSSGLMCKPKTYTYDLGFFIEVKQVGDTKERNIANAQLISRMKIRQATAKINDLAEEVDDILNRKNKEYFAIKKKLAPLILDDIKQKCSDSDFERLVLWYMRKIGANAYIPPKNQSGKTDGADADIVSEFEKLNVIIYVQVKKHVGQTGDKAIEQVEKYSVQMQDENSDYTYINWVISTADFSDETIEKSKARNVILVNGTDFAIKLLDVGFSNIDEFLE